VTVRERITEHAKNATVKIPTDTEAEMSFVRQHQNEIWQAMVERRAAGEGIAKAQFPALAKLLARKEDDDADLDSDDADDADVCETCDGSGQDSDGDECPTCHGTGKQPSDDDEDGDGDDEDDKEDVDHEDTEDE
jgi:RecJ-like exonuclease